MTVIKTEKRAGRPSKQEQKLKRQDRVPVGGFRDKLTVGDTDPNFKYRWILDIDATGSRVLQFLQGGYTFVKGEEVIVGEAYVFSSPDYGDIIRRPGNRQGDYLYLMKIPKDWYDEDFANKQKHVDDTELALHDPNMLQNDKEGVYGNIKIKNN